MKASHVGQVNNSPAPPRSSAEHQGKLLWRTHQRGTTHRDPSTTSQTCKHMPSATNKWNNSSPQKITGSYPHQPATDTQTPPRVMAETKRSAAGTRPLAPHDDPAETPSTHPHIHATHIRDTPYHGTNYPWGPHHTGRHHEAISIPSQASPSKKTANTVTSSKEPAPDLSTQTLLLETTYPQRTDDPTSLQGGHTSTTITQMYTDNHYEDGAEPLQRDTDHWSAKRDTPHAGKHEQQEE